MPKDNDPVFRAHYHGVSSPTSAPSEPMSCFDLPKQGCVDPSHRSCGDCLKALWNHRALFNKKKGGGCALCRLMQLTINLRRRIDVDKSFAIFDRLIREHLDYVVRTVDARHLVSFATNYADHSKDPDERGAAGALVLYNMMEKIAVSAPKTNGVTPKNTDKGGIGDATFYNDGCYDRAVSNFTMYDWRSGNAMGRCFEVVFGCFEGAHVCKRLLASCVAWSVLYGEATLTGKVARKAGEKEWMQRVIRGYFSSPR
nr:hypothetical protein TetV2_00345 [Oceanusvirus sp.]